MQPVDPKITALEDLVKRQSVAIDELRRRVLFLERENKRRQSEIQSIPTK